MVTSNSLLKIIGVALFLGVFSVSFAFAQTADLDIPTKLKPIAEQLGCSTKAACEASCSANLDRCISLAVENGVYSPTQKTLAKQFQDRVLKELSGATVENFEQKVIEVAKQIASKDPNFAKQLGVTKERVRAAETIVEEVRKEGVDLQVCSQSAESLTREQLVACLNASKRIVEKKDVVRPYIPQERIVRVEQVDVTIQLDKALAAGEYAELGVKTAEEVGVICLRPGSPAVCEKIAERFFGKEGLEELKGARAQVASVEGEYKKKYDNLTLIAPDGRKIVGKNAIRDACDQAFRTRNIALAKACGEFAVKNGFSEQGAIDEAVRVFESAVGNQNVNFNDCRRNPKACEQYIPEKERARFSVMQQIHEIMRAEIGFDPEQCEEGESNPEIGMKCFEGSKRALPKIKSIATTAEAQKIVAEIEGHIREGEDFERNRGKIEETFRTQGGPGGCKSENECRAYCSKPENGPECLAFGAQQGVINKDDVGRRFEQYNQSLERSFSQPFVSPRQISDVNDSRFPEGRPFQDQGFIPPGFNPRPFFGEQQGPSPECFAAISGGDFAKAKELCFGGSIPNPESRNLEQQFPYQRQQQACPVSYPVPCPAGQYRPDTRDAKGCFVPGVCTPIPGYGEKPSPTEKIGICPALPTVTSCSEGQTKVIAYSSPECGTYYSCQQNNQQPPVPQQVSFPYKFTNGKIVNSQEEAKEYCYANGPGSGQGVAAECETRFGVRYSQPVPPPPPPAPTAGREYRGGMYYSSGFMGCMERLGSGADARRIQEFLNAGQIPPPWGSLSPKGQSDIATCERESGWGSEYPQPTPSGQRQQAWNSLGLQSWVRADADSGRIDQLKAACANVSQSANVWMPNAGNSGSVDFGMPDPEKCRKAAACTSGQYFDGSSCANSSQGQTYPSSSTCSPELVSLLGSGCHYMYNDTDGSRVYCNAEMTKSAKSGDTSTRSGCSSSGTYNTTSPSPTACNGNGVCEYGESSGSCPGDCGSQSSTYQTPPSGGSCPSSFAHDMGGYCMLNNDTSRCAEYSNASSEGSYSATICQQRTGTSPSGSTGSYTSCPSGQYWDSGTNSCKTNTSPTSGSYPSCPSGQYWDFGTSSCKSNTQPTTGTNDPATACAQSGGSWNGSTCVFSSQPTTSSPTPTESTQSSAPTTSMYSRPLFANVLSVVQHFKSKFFSRGR